MSAWGETRILCASCEIGYVTQQGDICQECVRHGLEAVEGYLVKQAAFSEYLASQENDQP